jgi:hypothetical protein
MLSEFAGWKVMQKIVFAGAEVLEVALLELMQVSSWLPCQLVSTNHHIEQ